MGVAPSTANPPGPGGIRSLHQETYTYIHFAIEMRGLVVTNLVWTERSTELSEMCEERTRYLNDFQIH